MTECPGIDELEQALASGDAEIARHVRGCRACHAVVDMLRARRASAAEASCTEVELWLAAQEVGALAGGDEARLAQHLASCAVCRDLAAAGDDQSFTELAAVDRERYAFGGELGRGGMGRIVAAMDRRLGRPVAVKELLGRDGPLEARFRREALVTARLQHPAIVPVYEAGRWPSGEPFYVMKKVSGRSLHEVIAEARTDAARIALVPAVLAVAEAVAYAHSERIIHRDLKPANVLVGAFGETVVIDWGLAKDLADTAANAADAGEAGPYRTEAGALTVAGAVLGTPAYMPPEQARAEAVDERTDVYALGAILYHVLSGEPPYRGASSEEAVARVLKGPPAPIRERAPGAPHDLVAIVHKAMARRAEDRYANAGELADDLRRFQTGQLVDAHEYSRRELVRRWARRNRRSVVVGALAVLLLATGAVISVRRIASERDTARANRDVAVRERDRADQLAVGLLEDRGRRELLDGSRDRALVYLSAAYSRGLDTPALRFMLADAMQAIDGEVSQIAFDWATKGEFDHRGQRLVLRSVERPGVAVFDVATGALVAKLQVGTESLVDVRFTADDRYLVTGADDGKLRLWEVATGRLTHLVAAHRGQVRTTPVYDSGRRLATAGHEDGAIKLWDPATLSLVAEHHAYDDGVSELFVSPDERHLVSVGFGSTATVWDAQTGARLCDLRGDTARIIGIAGSASFRPDGQRIVLGDLGGTLRIWDVARCTLLVKRGGHGAPVGGIYDPTGTRILVVDARDDAYVADAETGAKIGSNGRSGWLWARFSADSTRVVSVAMAGFPMADTYVWDASNGAVMAHLVGTPLAFDVSHERVAISTGDRVSVVSLGMGRLHRVLEHDTPVSAVRFQSDQRHIWTYSRGGSQRVWDPSSGSNTLLGPPDLLIARSADAARQVVRITRGAELRDAAGAIVAPLRDLGEPVVQFSPDDRVLIAGGDGGALRILDARTGAVLASPSGHEARIRSIAVSGNGKRIATVDMSGQIGVWTEDGRRISWCRAAYGLPVEVVMSPDGSRMVAFVSNPDDGEAIAGLLQPVLYEVESCRPLEPLGPPSPEWPDPTFSARGLRLLVDRTVWDARDARRIAELPPRSTGERGLSLSPDGDLVAVAGDMGFLWDVATGKRCTDLEMGATSDVSFSPDGALLYAAHSDGFIRIWDVASGRLLGELPVQGGPIEVTRDSFQMPLPELDASKQGDLLVTTAHTSRALVWSVARERRSPEQIARLVAAHSRWGLERGTLVARRPGPTTHAPTTAAALPVEPEVLPCDRLSELRSLDNTTGATLRVVNASGEEIRLRWIDFQGAIHERPTDLIPPRDQTSQLTWTTHPFVLQRKDGRCVTILRPRPGDNQYVYGVRVAPTTSLARPPAGTVSVSGRVTRLGQPVPSAEVLLERAAGAPSLRRTIAAADGAFQFAGVEPGSYRVSALSMQAGAFMRPRPVEVREGENPPLAVELDLAGSIAGVVRDEEGHPLAGDVVRFEDAAATPEPASLDRSVYYRLTSKRPGDGECLEVVYDGKHDDQLVLARCHALGGQMWKLTPLGNGYYRLTTRLKGEGTSLDVVNDNKSNDQLVLAVTGPYSGQAWKLTPIEGGYYRLTTRWQGDGKSLDIDADGGESRRPILRDTGRFSGQAWKLTSTGVKVD